jgi:hypothetical protein
VRIGGHAGYRTDATDDDWQIVDGAELPPRAARRAARPGGVVRRPGQHRRRRRHVPLQRRRHDLDPHPDPCSADDAFLDSVAPVDTTHLFLLCVSDPGAGSQGKSVRSSSDAGATTKAEGEPPRGGIAIEIAAATRTTSR